jgi:hypothetical protein
VTATGLTLSWTAPADTRVVGYRVSSNGAQIGAPTAASFAVRGLTCGSSYSFTVVSVDVAGKTSPPAALTASSAACPLPEPTGLTAAARTATSVTLAWAKSTDTRVLSYRVSLNGTPVGTFTTATARVDSLVCGRSYSFSVVALGAAGTASVAATTTASTRACPPPDTTAPKVAFTAPVADRVVPRALTLSASATDAGGIREVDFYVDGVLVCADTTPDYSCPVTLSHGWHKLTARAIDRAGNAAATSIWVWAS